MILTAVAVDIHSRAWIVASIQKALRPAPGLLIYVPHTGSTKVSVFIVISRTKVGQNVAALHWEIKSSNLSQIWKTVPSIALINCSVGQAVVHAMPNVQQVMRHNGDFHHST